MFMGDAFDTALFKQSFQRVFTKDSKDDFKTGFCATIDVKVGKLVCSLLPMFPFPVIPHIENPLIFL